MYYGCGTMSGDELLVRDVMSSPPITMGPDANARAAAQVMIENGIGSIIVVNDNEKLIGIVTKTDFLSIVASSLIPESVKLADFMKRNPYYVYADAPLREAAELMGSKGIGHLPVLDPDTDRVIGVISKTDIVKMAPHFIELVYALRTESVEQEQ